MTEESREEKVFKLKTYNDHEYNINKAPLQYISLKKIHEEVVRY